MTELGERLNRVKKAWRRTEMLKGGAVVLADFALIVLVLIGLDAIYILPTWFRWVTLLGMLGGLSWMGYLSIFKPVTRNLAEQDIALYVENRFPQMEGTLLASVEYQGKPTSSTIQAELVGALVVDCLDRASHIDFKRIIDKRKLVTRGIAAGVICAIFLGAAAINPSLCRYGLVRVLTPWSNPSEVPKWIEKKMAKKEADEKQREMLEKLEKKEAELSISVSPGDTEVAENGSIRIQAVPNRIAGALSLRFKSQKGEWSTMDMPADPIQPDKFAHTLTDITVPMKYQVVMGDFKSKTYSIKVYDPADVKGFRFVFRYPKDMGLADMTMDSQDGSFEVLEGASVDVTLIASGPLARGSIKLNGKTTIPMRVDGPEATGTIKVERNGYYNITARDTRNTPIDVSERYSIRMIKIEPPTLELKYPGSPMTLVHPMAEVAFAAQAECLTGLKEVRLHYFYNEEEEEIVTLSCIRGSAADKTRLAEFKLPLEDRNDGKGTEIGDTIVFHLEAENLKGESVSSDMYLVSVRGWEAWASYHLGHSHGATHGYEGPDFSNILAAMWHLHYTQKTLTKQEFKAACEKLGMALESDTVYEMRFR